MAKIYIAGCGGMLGEAFYHTFRDDHELRCTDKDVNEEWLTFLDFRDLDAYREDVARFKPDFLFHLGAYTSLEYCEENIDDAYLTNTTSVENATYIANELGIPMLYISTAGIFDGSQDTFDDWDRPNPMGHYARSKYMGELFVTQNVREHLVCRAGWMMGGGPRKDKKFIQKLMKQLKEGKTELNVVHDKLGTPTYTFDFARSVKALMEKRYWGLYNMVCEGVTSRLEVAEQLVIELGIADQVKVNPVSSDFFKAEFFAPRPDSERLINRKLHLRGLNTMSDWRIALKAYLDRDYRDYL
ncbi:sugar nucleotide-binding protein [Methyloversatilis sp. XJ19-13]|uniref:SDR family oxidoreductase n=1 Tax=Methyloversatilis sp. XJ19-13 TaxID=2963430 RepID=UPI00211C4745|nr:sugar nucleotide-binding protein [Methyloversatilis sp. XJ19-13]MCQ9376257.1 sugar nucleotide-binding protein [Methyloversatilis sp. XJ19-13]